MDLQANEGDEGGREDVRPDGLEEGNAPLLNNGVQGGQAQAQAAQDDVNWNLMEWDRAEELTWERLLGLDGSLVFLEHVFWVASLNTLFILVFGKSAKNYCHELDFNEGNRPAPLSRHSVISIRTSYHLLKVLGFSKRGIYHNNDLSRKLRSDWGEHVCL